MGLLLIGSGIGLLYAQFNRLAVMDLIVKWWPVLFILLGIEILLQTYLNKNEDIKIKYDIFSMFMVLLILLAGVAIYSASETGLIDRARTELNSNNYAIQQTAEIPLENGIRRVVLETGGNPLKIDTTSSSSIVVHSAMQVRAQSSREANAKAEGNDVIWQKRSGDTLYLSLKNPGNGWLEGNTVILPENINYEIDLQSSSLNLNLASVKGNWSLQGPGSCSVKLGAGTDLLVNVIGSNTHSISGNLNWTKTMLASPTGSQPEEDSEQQIQTQSTLGKGTYKLNIINTDDLDINQMPY